MDFWQRFTNNKQAETYTIDNEISINKILFILSLNGIENKLL